MQIMSVHSETNVVGPNRAVSSSPDSLLTPSSPDASPCAEDSGEYSSRNNVNTQYGTLLDHPHHRYHESTSSSDHAEGGDGDEEEEDHEEDDRQLMDDQEGCQHHDHRRHPHHHHHSSSHAPSRCNFASNHFTPGLHLASATAAPTNTNEFDQTTPTNSGHANPMIQASSEKSGAPIVTTATSIRRGDSSSAATTAAAPPARPSATTAPSGGTPASATSAKQGPMAGTIKQHKEKKLPYSIRLSPFVDHSSSMPAFYVTVVEREADANTVIKVGRYENKKDTNNPECQPPIVFKSKVVSRSHAELRVDEVGQWFICDIGSSSGTFVNHMRLSPASEPSEPMLLKDGDVVQLGVDYRGGSEEVYKCIKVYVEVNRSWRKRANQFNVSTMKKLRNLMLDNNNSNNTNTDSNDTSNSAVGGGVSESGQPLQECAICLLPLAPCQALFISPCSHGWHYKCIRPIVVKSYPHFMCPNCRRPCDLEADIDMVDEDEEEEEEEEEEQEAIREYEAAAAAAATS